MVETREVDSGSHSGNAELEDINIRETAQKVEQADQAVAALKALVPVLSVAAGALTALPSGLLLTTGVVASGIAAAAAAIFRVREQNRASALRQLLAQAEDAVTAASHGVKKP